ncbi:MAG TPA: phBC6A51 family helix-turn-helix protein [Acidimicrobiales bacterium]|nr:phBC6A51 family helix-turn-helix protein [Acidimicrobiales bacterium]
MRMTPEKERLLTWLMTPREDREPRKQADLAREMGLDPTTISNWKNDSEFLEEWNRRYLKGIGSPETKNEIMSTLLRTATDPDDPKHVQAAKAYFEIEGSLRPVKNQVDISVSAKAPSDLSDDELKKLLAAKADDELARRREVS